MACNCTSRLVGDTLGTANYITFKLAWCTVVLQIVTSRLTGGTVGTSDCHI